MYEIQSDGSLKVIKKYTPEEIAAMDKAADANVMSMMITGAGMGAAPIGFDIMCMCVGASVGVIGIARCFNFKLTKDDAADLIIQFMKAAGKAYSVIFFGSKITGSLFKSNPVSYIPAMIADGVLNGATFFAVGNTAKRYFRSKAEGKPATEAQMRQWMHEGKRQGEALAREHAQHAAQAQTAK